MTDDLIYRSELKKELLKRSFFPAIVAALKIVPAVDADYYTNCLAWICSCCDYRFADKSKNPKSPKLNYCPNCGAKMEG